MGNDPMREALEPFAAFADALNEEVPDNIAIGFYADGAMRFGPNGGTTVGSLRKARAALAAPVAAATEGVREALEDMIQLAGKHVYPQPDKPDSAWGRLERAKAALAKDGAGSVVARPERNTTK